MALAVLFPREAHAYDEDSAAVQANKGFHFGLGPVLLIPTDAGPLGGGLDVELRYGIGLDPIILAPGARLSGYFISGRFIGMATPTLRLTLPVGPLAPFVLGGVGPGVLTNPGESGVALLGGGCRGDLPEDHRHGVRELRDRAGDSHRLVTRGFAAW
jgi:hypothetical protein